jgi:hypothetical protein
VEGGVPTRRRIILAGIATGILLVLSFVTLGIPGALMIELVAAVFKPLGAKVPTGDAAWPAAILVAFLMPFGVLASAFWLARNNPSAGTGASFGWGALGYVAAGVLLSLVVVFVLAK